MEKIDILIKRLKVWSYIIYDPLVNIDKLKNSLKQLLLLLNTKLWIDLNFHKQ